MPTHVLQGDREVAERDHHPVRFEASSICHYRKRDYATAFQTTDTRRDVETTRHIALEVWHRRENATQLLP